MFFTECGRLARQHPGLASVFQQLDASLQTVGIGAVLRSEDLASFLSIRLNQARSALDLLVAEGLLRRIEMIECRYCEMAVDLTDYMDAVDEEGEYRCTSCDRVLGGGAAVRIGAYVPGEPWPIQKVLPDQGACSGPSTQEPSTLRLDGPIDENAWYTHGQIAKAYRINGEALRKRLTRFRARTVNGWKENDDRRTGESNHLYRPAEIKSIIEGLRVSG